MGESFITRSSAALADHSLKRALAKAQSGFAAKRAAAVAECDDFAALRRRARLARERALDHLAEYLEQFERQVQAAGGTVHWAETPADMRTIVIDICRARNARFITKGKSMVSEEVGLNQALEQAGFTVNETDLGEYIIQLAGETPSHIVAPALHKTREQITDLFRTHHTLGDRPLEEVAAIVDEARTVIRERFLRADVGITGANMLIAETGQVVLVTNEGNGDLTAGLPGCHIVTASIEKVVANREDASAILRVLARSSTGQHITAYTSFFTGPGGNAAQDAPAFHVVLLDNGRSDMLAGPYRDMLRCIKCAACLNHCPVYQSVGGHAYDAVYPGPMGSVLTPLLRGELRDFQLPAATTACGRCDEVCPVEIPLTSLMRQLRQDTRTPSTLARLTIRCYTWLARYPRLYRLLTNIAMTGLRLLAGGGKPLSRLPLAHAWTRHKDLPALPPTTFQQQWQKRGDKR